MVVSICLRVLLRRLALRKGLAVIAASVFLVGTGLLYLSLEHVSLPSSSAVRTISVPTARTKAATHNLTRPHPHPSTPRQVHPTTPHRTDIAKPISRWAPKDQAPHGDGGGGPGLVAAPPPSSEECSFSSAQPSHRADVEMLDLFDKLPFSDPDGGVWKQGFDITYSMESFQDDPLQVFVVPHSHNDPGWLRTFEEYYRRQTRYILSYLTDSLATHSERKFIWAEISYLDMWWQEQSESQRKTFTRLCEKGQMEIVTGGWVMNDEANTHYFAMIDQLMEGHQWLKHNMPGVIPRSGWAIDPFGYTPTMAFLLRRMGLDAMVIQRVHYAIKKHLAQNKQLEFAWRQLWDQGGSTDMFCHTFPFYSYDIPHTCGPDPKICCQFDFHRLPGSKVDCPWRIRPQAITDANVVERSHVLADQYRKKAQLYRTNVLLVPLGDDFRYESQKEVETQYSNYEKLMRHMNTSPDMKINVQFGTLLDYFSAVRNKAGVWDTETMLPAGFPSLSGDFFTYNDRTDNFWSGYFTSRPFYKNLDRVLEDSLRAAEVIYSLSVGAGHTADPSLPHHLTDARRSLGLFQHHDGITGTAKEHVVVDYAKKLTDAIAKSKIVMAMSARSLLLEGNAVPDSLYFDLEETHPNFDGLAVHTIIALSSPRNVFIYNSLTAYRQQLVRLHVDRVDAMVTDAFNRTMPCQVGPVWEGAHEMVSGEFELVFPVSLAPLSLTQFVVMAGSENSVRPTIKVIAANPPESAHFNVESAPRDDFMLTTDHLRATFSGSTGLLKTLSTGDDQDVAVAIDFLTYGTRGGKEKSGAYLFLPDGDARTITGQRSLVSVTAGPLLQEVRVELDLVTHCVQLSNTAGPDGRAVSVRNLVDIRRESNKELVMRLTSSIENPDGVFYSDLNGLQLVRRRTVSKLPMQGNFYPMPSTALLQDHRHRLSLLSAQSLGTASLKQGWLEVVLDRRLMQDDFRGLGQGTRDNLPTPSSFRLLLEQRTNEASPTAELAYPSLLAHANLDQLLHPPHTLIIHPHTAPVEHLAPTHSSLDRAFPCDLHLVNLRSLFTPSLEHTSQAALILHRRAFDCGFGAAPVQCHVSEGKVALGNMFTGIHLSEVHATSLTLLHELEPLSAASAFEARLPPMELKTFRLSW